MTYLGHAKMEQLIGLRDIGIICFMKMSKQCITSQEIVVSFLLLPIKTINPQVMHDERGYHSNFVKRIMKDDYKKVISLRNNSDVLKSPALDFKYASNDNNYKKHFSKVCKKKPISFEVFADDPKNMLKQAYEINSWGKNIYVKIPVVNSKGVFTGSVIKELSDKGIKLNITAVYTFEQTKKIYIY